MKKIGRTILSWIIAFGVAAIFMRVVVISIAGKFDSSLWSILIIPIAMLAVPFYIIIKKRLL